VRGRVADFEKLYREVKAMDATAAPEIYLKTSQEARKLLEAGKLYAADICLGPACQRDAASQRPVGAARGARAARGRRTAHERLARRLAQGGGGHQGDTGDYLACHMYFPNSWTGPDDLSARCGWPTTARTSTSAWKSATRRW